MAYDDDVLGDLAAKVSAARLSGAFVSAGYTPKLGDSCISDLGSFSEKLSFAWGRTVSVVQTHLESLVPKGLQ